MRQRSAKRRTADEAASAAFRRDRLLFALLALVGLVGSLLLGRCMDATHSTPTRREDSVPGARPSTSHENADSATGARHRMP